MIFTDVTIHQLFEFLRPHMNEPLWPGITSDAAKERGCEHAKKTGLWDRLHQILSPDAPLPALRFSEYQGYFRTGLRQPYQGKMDSFEEATHMAALGLWMDHPAASVDRLSDLMWQWCGSSWSLPAHASLHIELVSARVGRMLAEYNWLFADRLEKPVRDRVAQEIDKRMLDVALDWRRHDWWTTTDNNWNLVCNTELVQIGLYQIRDPGALATFVHTLCRRLDYAIAYFSPDGFCREGPGYWEYGFTHFLNVAIALRQRTGGKIDLAADEHVRKICLAPLATQLQGNQRATFGDAGHDYVKAQTALKVQHLIGSNALLRYVEPLANGLFPMDHVRTFALYDGQRADPTPDHSDYFMPDVGYVKLNGGPGQLLAAIAGNNGVGHSHNDIGSFMLLFDGTVVLTDPGSPEYTAKTFGPDRYEMLFCRSKGHSVPLINGHEQAAGAQHAGTMEVVNLNADKEKVVGIDMTRAYADPTLLELKRELSLSQDGELGLTDNYQFSAKPTSVEEAFVTFEKVTLASDARSARLGGAGAVLTALSPGRFSVEVFLPEQHEGGDRRPLSRIAFHPAQLDRKMRLAFSCSARK